MITVERLGKAKKRMNVGFVLSIVAFVAFIAAANLAEGSDGNTVLSGIAVVAMLSTLVGAVLFYSGLGSSAAILNRSPIVWVGLSFITAPIGPVVSYFWMRSLVDSQVASLSSSE